jgi:uncharacterized protein
MSLERPHWRYRLEQVWSAVAIAWLAGVRRSGKTTLAKALPDATFLNCDLPSVQRELTDPERFLAAVKTPHLVLDEVHRLADPAQILKIAADEYPTLRVLATGSSTLAATGKFSDALTGRKRSVHLVPVLPEECAAFGVSDIRVRLWRGGLPPALLATTRDDGLYSEWADSFFARDVQELFRIEKRQPFLKLLEWLMRHNGAQVEMTELARVSGISRPTAVHYMEALEITQAITVLRPFHGGRAHELTKQPKVYAFDTGFVCHARGWGELRPEDGGHLLENLALESLQASSKNPSLFYWRTKQQREIDLVATLPGRVDAIECKWRSHLFSPDHLHAFRKEHPIGRNWLVTADGGRPRTERFDEMEVNVVPIEQFRSLFDALNASPGAESHAATHSRKSSTRV